MRTIVVLAAAAIGVTYAVQSPLNALLFYLWIAYFRPEQWVWNAALVEELRLSYVAGLGALIATSVSPTRLRFDLRIALLGLFLLHSWLSAVFAIHPDYAWPFWLEFFKTVVIAYLIVILAGDAERFRLVLLVIAMSLGLEAAKQGWVGMLLHPGSRNDNMLPMLGDNNGVAVGMLMLLPLFTTLTSTAGSTRTRYLYRVMAVGVLYRGISTYSRGAFLACGALGLVYILRGQRRIATLAAIVALAAVITPLLPDAFWERMSTIGTPKQLEEQHETSALSRLHFWQIAVKMANDHMWLGVGHNSYNAVYSAYDNSNSEFGENRSVHSVWFGILAELGYPGLVLFLAQLGFAFAACRRARRAAAADANVADLKKFAFAIEGALVAFIVGGTFLPFQYKEIVWHVIALSIALNLLAGDAMRSTAAARAVPVEPGPLSPTPFAVAGG